MEIIELTKKLIKIPSVSSNIKENEKIALFVKEFFDRIWKWYIQTYKFNNVFSVIVSNFQWKESDIILNWHLDVVPEYSKKDFKPYIKDGKLFWRGSWDMKSWVAIIMLVMKKILEEGFTKKKVSLILTTDEEVGGFDGVGQLTKLWYKWKVVLIPDSWSLTDIVYAEKWIVIMDFEIYGRSAHSSRPWLWDNAIDKLIDFYRELKSIVQQNTKSKWRNTVNLNIVKAWKTSNALPDIAKWTIDIRFIEWWTKKSIIQIVNKLLRKYNWKLIKYLHGEVLFTKKNHKYIREYKNIASETIWQKINLIKEHWWSDGRFFAEKWSVVLLHRPTCWNIHWKDEWVKVNDLQKLYNIYYNFIKQSSI